MQWSKLRSQVEDLFADSVKGRVRLHSTRYRKMHDQQGRAWITIDGEEIVNMTNLFKWLYQRDRRAAELAGVEPGGQTWEDYASKWCDAEQELRQESVFWQGDLGDAMFSYLQSSIDHIVSSDNILIRAIGMLDRRVGKRRLAILSETIDHPLVALLHTFRCDAEGMQTFPREP